MYFDAGGTFYFRDVDGSYANRVTIDSANGNTVISGTVDAIAGFKDNGSAGIDKTFSFRDYEAALHEIVISGGIITQWNVTP